MQAVRDGAALIPSSMRSRSTFALQLMNPTLGNPASEAIFESYQMMQEKSKILELSIPEHVKL